jgi:hypothetical protein
MSQLRPHFYPIAIHPEVLPPRSFGQSVNHNVKVVKPPPMERDKLLALYADAHKYVHRGNLKKLLSSKFSLDQSFDLGLSPKYNQFQIF